MPDTSRPDDPFADLYGKLPAAGGHRAQGETDTARTATAVTAAEHDIDALLDASSRSGRRAKEDRDRRKSRIAGWVVFLVVLAIIGGVVWGGYSLYKANEDTIQSFLGNEEPYDYEDGVAEGEAIVTIIDGDTGEDISHTLFESGVTMTDTAFYRYLISTGQNPTFQPGVFSLQQKMSSSAALDGLMDEANRLDNTALLREGLTVEQSLTALAEATEIPLEDLQSAASDTSQFGVDAPSLEGWLFPDTYTFDPDVTATQVLQELVDRTSGILDEVGVPTEDRQEILTIASIIEREARFQEDFFKVSRVIQNRLDPETSGETGGLLQMDSTAQYGYSEMHDGTVSSSEEALTDDNPWNTYVHAGLPAGPIANPGRLAIEAALSPEEGPWLYFVTVDLDTGETVFSDTFAEHEEAIQQWDQWCQENRPGEVC